MDETLLLAHLPLRFSHHRELNSIKSLSNAPTASDLSYLLSQKLMSNRDAWLTINHALKCAELTFKNAKKNGIHWVSFWSESYPHRLRLIDYPPWHLFFKGNLPLAHPTLAVVGTRKPNHYGVELLSSFIPYLTTYPLQLISGLAYGVDSLSHLYACQAGIPNFAVLGSGVDVIYPAEHVDLARKILEGGGGVLSEFPPGTPPLASHFPRRNRIISGLADVVWIVQGAAKSGSLHTAKYALDQNRTIAVCPGDVFSELSDLPHALLQDGAHPIVRPNDLDMLLSGIKERITH